MIYLLFNVFNSDFIYPIFIHEDNFKSEIPSMPGCFRFGLTDMMVEVEDAIRYVNERSSFFVYGNTFLHVFEERAMIRIVIHVFTEML